jgi:hypothetical protein
MAQKRFSAEQVATIERMVEAGHTSVVIAKQLGCKPSAIRSKCANMGLTLRKPKPEHGARFSIPKHAYAAFVREAAARGMSPNRLAAQLLTVIAEDQLIDTLITNLTDIPAVDEPAPTATIVRPALPADMQIGVSLATLRCPQLVGTMP